MDLAQATTMVYWWTSNIFIVILYTTSIHGIRMSHGSPSQPIVEIKFHLVISLMRKIQERRFGRVSGVESIHFPAWQFGPNRGFNVSGESAHGQSSIHSNGIWSPNVEWDWPICILQQMFSFGKVKYSTVGSSRGDTHSGDYNSDFHPDYLAATI